MLADDVRECPATWTLAASWVVVFALMHLVQWESQVAMPPGGLGNPLAVSPLVGHRFGDMTWGEVRRGEVWRLVTATFVHFSLIHIGMNAFGMVRLGQLMEPWYRAGPFLAICLAIGGLGNLIGGLMRQGVTLGRAALAGSWLARAWPAWFDGGGAQGVEASFRMASGGGSTILLGLLGLGAVVGWRSRTRIGSFHRDQMLTMLGFTAVLGVVLFDLIDNYGHAGGAVAGALIGFAHRPLIRLAEHSRRFNAACWAASAACVLACTGAAVRDDRHESGYRAEFDQAQARSRAAEGALADLKRASVLYVRNLAFAVERGAWDDEFNIQEVLDSILKRMDIEPLPATPRPLSADQWRVRTRVELRIVLDSLRSRATNSWGPEVAADLAEVDRLGRLALEGAPDYRQVYAFAVAWRSASAALIAERDRAQARLVQIDRDFR